MDSNRDGDGAQDSHEAEVGYMFGRARRNNQDADATLCQRGALDLVWAVLTNVGLFGDIRYNGLFVVS